MKQFFFLCGLPRSGSTLLASILNQNPAIYASANSALVELLVNVRHHLRTTEQARAFMHKDQERDVLRAIMEGMYQFTEKPYIIDKSRAWPHPHNIELLTSLLPNPPKFIVTVRDLPSILTSFMRLITTQKERTSYIDRALRAQQLPLTIEHRCHALFSPTGAVYESWHTLKAALDGGYGANFFLIEYDDLVTDPATTLSRLYAFLGMPAYKHTFDAIVNQTPEDDAVYGIDHMHEVRPVLKKTSPDPRAVLGAALYEQYQSEPHFWRTAPEPSLAHNPFHFTL